MPNLQTVPLAPPVAETLFLSAALAFTYAFTSEDVSSVELWQTLATGALTRRSTAVRHVGGP